MRAVHDELFDIVKTDREAGIGTASRAKNTTGPRVHINNITRDTCCDDRGEPVPSKHAGARFIEAGRFPYCALRRTPAGVMICQGR